MAGEYIWAKNQKEARKKLMQIKPKNKKLTIVNRAPSLDNKLGHRGKAYYYIFDPKEKRGKRKK